MSHRKERIPLRRRISAARAFGVSDNLIVFWRWWWQNRRGEFRAWLRSPAHVLPKSASRAFREAGGKLKTQ